MRQRHRRQRRIRQQAKSAPPGPTSRPRWTRSPHSAPGARQKPTVTSALAAITTDLQTIKDAQADLTPERKQQVQDATTAFGTQLKDIVRQTIAGLATTDPKTQASDAAASLKSAVTASLQPIDC